MPLFHKGSGTGGGRVPRELTDPDLPGKQPSNGDGGGVSLDNTLDAYLA